ncbi:hypothetical protein QFZ37_002221 [Chryseobacterium ginsenosidimutans]|uniref:hypothetical protein n=1 Tax=Chryseobacterium ginsenosidimutans TaxID=687846 RepID=UPI00277EAB28|nr:hypothetical protein [Chryseobacterium ginsenosidimutans]MDQ0593852.1 hypothetical protein [Chryseobacterium ginsenosidimutans]
METQSILLQDSLLVIWNNRNSAERLKLMETIYAPDIKFFEDDKSEPFTGFTAIDDLIQKLQQDLPADFEFTLTTAPKSNHNIQHISWQLGIPGQQPVAAGSDVAIIEEGKIKSLYLFLAV